MPIYEYLCSSCGRVSSHLVLPNEDFSPFCSVRGGKDVKKIISRANVRLSEETRMERILDPLLRGEVDETDPNSLKKWMHKAGSLAGDEVEGDFAQMVDEAVEEAASTAGSGECEA